MSASHLDRESGNFTNLPPRQPKRLPPSYPGGELILSADGFGVEVGSDVGVGAVGF